MVTIRFMPMTPNFLAQNFEDSPPDAYFKSGTNAIALGPSTIPRVRSATRLEKRRIASE
jgi:hypothetical protein